MTNAAEDIVVLVYIGLLFGLLVLAIAMHLLISKQKARTYQSQLDEANRKLEQEMTKMRFEIHEEELEKVSADIHDNIGQVLSSVGLSLEAVQIALLSEKDQLILKQSVTRINRTTDELRHLAYKLNGARIERNGLLLSLQTEVAYLQLSGVISARFVNTTGLNRLPIPGTKALLLFRIAQEAITNVLRHARATKLLVRVSLSDKQVLQMMISDDGKGINQENLERGMGLATMEKRAGVLKGNFEIQNNPGGGTTISVQINL